MKVRTLLVALAAATVCVALPGAARALDPPSASCNGGGCDGWFTSNVSVSWSFNSSGATGASGCGGATVTEDTSECDVHVHGQLWRLVRREQRHGAQGLLAALGDGRRIARSRRQRLVHEPCQLQLHR